MAVTFMSYDQPHVFAAGKAAQTKFYPGSDKLRDDKQILSQFISERSWLLFEHVKPYLLLTHPGDDPDNDAAPIVTDVLAFLQEYPATWGDDDDYICRRYNRDSERVELRAYVNKINRVNRRPGILQDIKRHHGDLSD